MPEIYPQRDDETGPRAIEVATMLGDSVVGVSHVMNPRGGKVRTATWAALGAGAALLCAAVITFATAVSIARTNDEARRTWIDELDQPAHEFRPVPVSRAYDVLAFGGLAVGIGAIAWGLWRLRAERQQPVFRIGTASGVELAIEGAPAAAFPLVAPRGDDFVFSFTPAMSGEANIDGASMAFAELVAQGRATPSLRTAGAFELPMTARTRVRARAGKTTMLVSSVAAPKRSAAAEPTIERRMLAFFGASATAHILAVVMLGTIPPDPRSLSLDLGSAEQRLTRVSSKAEEDPKQAEPEPDGSDVEGNSMEGAKTAGESGKAGTDRVQNAEGRIAMKNNQMDPQMSKTQAVEQARSSGWLGAMRQQTGGAFAAFTGGEWSSGIDDIDAYGGFEGDAPGEASGNFGFGPSGFGPGGGGDNWGGYGAGKYGLIGPGPGGCAPGKICKGYDYGDGLRNDHRGPKGPEVIINPVDVGPEYSKELIRRYIRRKLPQIKYCYEKQLLAKPGLEGTVTLGWQISPTGAVLGAHGSGMDSTVASCVTDVVKTIVFPKPTGGLLVNVRKYPFTFRPTGR